MKTGDPSQHRHRVNSCSLIDEEDIKNEHIIHIMLPYCRLKSVSDGNYDKFRVSQMGFRRLDNQPLILTAATSTKIQLANNNMPRAIR